MDTLRYHASRVGQFWRERLGKATLAMAVVLLVSAVLGYALCASNPEVTNALMEYFMSVMLESGVVSETGMISVVDLLLNNWMAILLCVLYGFLPFFFSVLSKTVDSFPCRCYDFFKYRNGDRGRIFHK